MERSGPPEESSRPGGWRLARSSSAYLRAAAEQAVRWYPWGSEAFEEARRLRRPILLDVGAVWCHWCHVMDEGTYSDAEVARLIEQHFVAVKVDRDELPEVDRRYQRQVHVLSGEGGWPLTAFLTPEGEVFLGGTYFPAQDGVGRPGLRRVLREVARLWKEEPERVSENASAIRGALKRSVVAPPAAVSAPELILGIRRDLSESFDPVHAGFGGAPKFPHPTALAFLLLEERVGGDPAAGGRVRATLQAMADGGMYDQLGGGFHRYSVDEGWRIPHFEKMGVDNAALLDIYVDGARRFGGDRFTEVIRETAGWVRGTLALPGGGFGASQDADNAPGDDGSYFTWSRAELKSALDPDEFRFVHRFFGVGGEGRMPHDPDRNVLYRPIPWPEALEGTGLSPEEAARRLALATGKLRSVRAARPTPTVDRVAYAQVNGAFIRAFARAGQFLEDRSLVAEARAAADRFLADGYRPERGVAHRLGPEGPTGFGLLDDQAEFALGLIELSAVLAEPRYIAAARELLSLVLEQYSSDSGVLVDLAPKLYDGPELGPIREVSFPLEDSPHLSANSATALALVRLAALTGEARWKESALALVGKLASRLHRAGLFGAGAGWAAELASVEPVRVVVEGDTPDAERLYRAATTLWHPLIYVFRGRPPPPFSLPEELSGEEAGRTARALVCTGSRCLPPLTDPERLAAELTRQPT